MRAVIAPAPGGPEALELVERDDPQPGRGELLVRVHGAGVNRADVLQRQGAYPPPPGASDVLGLEVAGEVVAVGRDVGGVREGEPVCSILAGGGYAELAIVPAATALPVPPGMDLLTAGALPEVFATAYDNVHLRAGLRAGETLLVHGGSSGVGTAAIQLARRAGARVIVTASSREKLEACAELGADAGVDYRSEDFVEAVRAFTDGRGADVILDIIGGRYLERNVAALAADGRLVIIGLMGGTRGELDLGRLLTRRLTVLGSTLRARDIGAKAELTRRLRTEVWPGFDDGTLRPVIDTVLPLAEAAQAHRRMESSAHIGKILLDCRKDPT